LKNRAPARFFDFYWVFARRLFYTAVEQIQKVEMEIWTSKLLVDGYYMDLQELTKNRPICAILLMS